jgi:hypothetical protein
LALLLTAALPVFSVFVEHIGDPFSGIPEKPAIALISGLLACVVAWILSWRLRNSYAEQLYGAAIRNSYSEQRIGLPSSFSSPPSWRLVVQL